MDRRDKIFLHIDKAGAGLEIGPSHSPLAPKKEGYNVEIIDVMGRDELVEKYGVPDRIEEVDYVWKGQSFQELTGKSKHYDYIIASHVIEHAPDLIGFLNSCDAVLKDSGVISLAVPDKRFHFDRFRPISGISRVIDSHLNQSAIHSAGSVAEFYLNVVSMDGFIAWSEEAYGDLEFLHTPEDARKGIAAVTQERAFIDVHAWCFVPSSFRLLIHDLHALGFIAFQEVSFLPTSGYEFYLTLGRQGRGIDSSRMEMLERIEWELSQATLAATNPGAGRHSPAGDTAQSPQVEKPWWKRWG